MYESGAYSDFVFDIKGVLFRTHKCILASRSKYFQLKFENKWKSREYITGSNDLVKNNILTNASFFF